MTLHPEVRTLIDEMTGLQRAFLGPPVPGIADISVERLRRWMPVRRRTLGTGPSVRHVRDMTIPTPSATLRARLYQPVPHASALWIWFHGGGCVVGSLEDQDPVCRLMAATSGVDVLSVDYRLAPEHPFPAASDDAFHAVNWAADTLGLRRTLIVGGESAGGNLAAVTARRISRQGGPSVALQTLVQPMMDADFGTDSYVTYGDGEYLLSTQLMQWFWDQYVPDRGQRTDPDAAPLHAPDLSGLPPAIVVVAGHDPLHDEAVAYARRLQHADVPTKLMVYHDMIHGFWVWANRLSRGADAVSEVCREVRTLATRTAQ